MHDCLQFESGMFCSISPNYFALFLIIKKLQTKLAFHKMSWMFENNLHISETAYNL